MSLRKWHEHLLFMLNSKKIAYKTYLELVQLETVQDLRLAIETLEK